MERLTPQRLLGLQRRCVANRRAERLLEQLGGWGAYTRAKNSWRATQLATAGVRRLAALQRRTFFWVGGGGGG